MINHFTIVCLKLQRSFRYIHYFWTKKSSTNPVWPQLIQSQYSTFHFSLKLWFSTALKTDLKHNTLAIRGTLITCRWPSVSSSLDKAKRVWHFWSARAVGREINVGSGRQRTVTYFVKGSIIVQQGMILERKFGINLCNAQFKAFWLVITTLNIQSECLKTRIV